MRTCDDTIVLSCCNHLRGVPIGFQLRTGSGIEVARALRLRGMLSRLGRLILGRTAFNDPCWSVYHCPISTNLPREMNIEVKTIYGPAETGRGLFFSTCAMAAYAIGQRAGS
jgi:hypothetical protein